MKNEQEKCACSQTRRYKASKNYILREIAGEAVLVSVGDGVADFCGIVNLNPSARVLWKKLQDGATKEELVCELKETFEGAEESAEQDVEATVQMLKERGLVTYEQ
ncbi:MAG: PqqD family protein [Lachnospiraceae bacterium]|nr:PqqD family protein [Lachnospiraceae bacterium]